MPTNQSLLHHLYLAACLTGILWLTYLLDLPTPEGLPLN